MVKKYGGLIAFLMVLGILIGFNVAQFPKGAVKVQNSSISSTSSKQKIVVIGVSGLRWTDVNSKSTPTLNAFTKESASANIVLRTVGEKTPINAGWLTLGAGARVSCSDMDICLEQPTLTVVGAGYKVNNWQGYKDVNKSNGYQPQLGALGNITQENNVSLGAVGSRAALALADEQGIFTGTYQEFSASLRAVDSKTTGLQTKELLQAYQNVAQKDLVLIDLDVSDPKIISQQLTALLSQISADANVIIATVGGMPDDDPRLGMFASRGIFSRQPALSYTNSTRQIGLVQLTDLLPTIYAKLAITIPSYSVGSPILSAQISNLSTMSYLVDAERKAFYTRQAVVPFYLLFTFSILGLVFLALLFRKLNRLVTFSRHSLLLLASLPVASLLANLLPWWRGSRPVLAFLFTVMLLAIFITIVVTRFNTHRFTAPALIATLTLLTMVADILLGSHLQFPSVLANQPQAGGRFYGFANAPFTFFAVSLLFVLAYFSIQLNRWNISKFLQTVFLFGILMGAVWIDASPSLGADFGGTLPLVGGIVAFVWMLNGRKFNPFPLILSLMFGLALIGGISYADWLRSPASRSHLGNFVQAIYDGRALAVITRKLSQMLNSAPLWAWFLIILLLLVIFVLYRKYGKDLWKVILGNLELPKEFIYATLSALILMVVGLAINDSGLVIPFIGIFYGVPLLLSGVSSTVISDRR